MFDKDFFNKFVFIDEARTKSEKNGFVIENPDGTTTQAQEIFTYCIADKESGEFN